jgi:glyoxylase-like metal-dependent hydrolase (beta-lactamase superfamily II)
MYRLADRSEAVDLKHREIGMKLKLDALLAAAMIAATPAACAASDMSPAHAAPSAGWIAQQAPGFYRFALGDFRITVLSDGTAPRNVPNIMSKPDEVRAAYAAAHEALPVELSINCFLVDTGTRRMLVDTGAGELFGATSGQLIANLRASGYQPEDIDVILLTHIHGDHSGGLSIGGQRVFPNVLVYVDRHDPDYWLSASVEAKAPADRRTTFTQAHKTVDPYVDAGKLRTFDGATELFPGVRTVPEHGHTPGLTGYMIESRGQRLLLWGDIVHSAEVQFRDPTVTVDYDVDPKEAVVSRRRIFDNAAKQGYLVGGAHISFPGLGHVHAEKTGYSWAPMPYSVILQKLPDTAQK